MQKRKKTAKRWIWFLGGAPLAAAAGATFLQVQRLGLQFLVLILLLWLQVFFIVNVLLINK